MKHLLYILCISLLVGKQGKANSIFIDFSDNTYRFNRQLLKDGGKECLVINGLRKKMIMTKPKFGNRPLAVFQIFDYTQTVVDTPSLMSSRGFVQYLNAVILPMLDADRKHISSDLASASFSGTFSVLFDTVIVKEKGVFYVITGAIKVDFFNLLDYEPTDPLEVNQSIFNTKALVAPVYSWVLDSIPVFRGDYIDRKILLLKKEHNDYHFYKYPERNEDSPISFISGFVYRKDVGVVGLKSKYLQVYRGSPNSLFGPVYSSDPYYFIKCRYQDP